MLGRAVDIFVPGLSLDKLRDAAEDDAPGGVGHYPFSGPRFVHIDTGPQRHWTEMDPSVRRRLGLAKRGRTRFKLNCDMTMADALREISPFDAIAALPPGASVDPAASLHKAAYFQALPTGDQTQTIVGRGDAGPASIIGGEGRVCEGADPLPPLSLLVGAAQQAQQPN